MQQLEAFRQDDFTTAYTFASVSVRQMFDRAGFEQMVRGGYPGDRAQRLRHDRWQPSR